MSIGLGHQDEFFHAGYDDSRFSDWLDFNFYDISRRIGGFIRLHHRPGHGYTEMTVCLYLPDGRTVFMTERSGARGDHQLAAGGLSIEVIRPFDELRASYLGKLLLLEDPTALFHPEQADALCPQTDGRLELTFSGLSTLYEDNGDPSVEPGTSIAGHYEQLIAVTGSVRAGEDRSDVDGLGLRGHGWGRRVGQTPAYRRRLTANVGPSFGFMGFSLGGPGGARLGGGFVWDGTAFHVTRALSITTHWSGADCLPHGLDLTLRDGDQAWHARGTVVSLLVRPDDSNEGTNDGGAAGTRISEGVTEWRLDDGQIGYGMTEYCDQIVDGKPTGLAD